MGALFAIGALLAGPASAKAVGNAKADGGIVATTTAVGHTIEVPGRRDAADAQGGRGLRTGGPEEDGGRAVRTRPAGR